MATLTSLKTSWDCPIDLTDDGPPTKITANRAWPDAQAPRVESWPEPARKRRRVESPNEASRLDECLNVGCHPVLMKVIDARSL